MDRDEQSRSDGGARRSGAPDPGGFAASGDGWSGVITFVLVCTLLVLLGYVLW